MFQFPKKTKKNMVLILIFLNNSRVNLDSCYRVYCSRDGKAEVNHDSRFFTVPNGCTALFSV